MKMKYYTNDGHIDCTIGTCKNYKENIDYILKIYEELKDIL